MQLQTWEPILVKKQHVSRWKRLEVFEALGWFTIEAIQLEKFEKSIQDDFVGLYSSTEIKRKTSVSTCLAWSCGSFTEITNKQLYRSRINFIFFRALGIKTLLFWHLLYIIGFSWLICIEWSSRCNPMFNDSDATSASVINEGMIINASV